jgi:hypothetical protein
MGYINKVGNVKPPFVWDEASSYGMKLAAGDPDAEIRL